VPDSSGNLVQLAQKSPIKVTHNLAQSFGNLAQTFGNLAQLPQKSREKVTQNRQLCDFKGSCVTVLL